jgi:hypothetical protein
METQENYLALLERVELRPGTIDRVQDEIYDEMIQEIQDLFYPPEGEE